MSQHDELYPADLHRLKAAAIRESHRLRNEALWSTPGVLRRTAAGSGFAATMKPAE